ncbi:urea carboxylase [Amycolatopsis echigonensis]|uniref:Urea carboxylase n=1 Tax=Amycolatopsis echigonensis TaxID=2576905 RepID=A0A2N3X1V8_9PSEU|nr:carboxyltransferase domain-containing protein [Amycolatopsis niigatensis]PKW00112.1 urea carboxylase [Amycolatopsis niigatensis]
MTRYTPGGDEHLFVEYSEEMTLEAFFTSILVSQELAVRKIDGITENCPANASLQVRFDPDVIAARDVQRELEDIEAAFGDVDKVLDTRIVEIPVLYNDPWTHEVLMRFRERHQDPDSTDIEYAARINDLSGVDAFIEAHSSTPWFVSTVGFVAGLPFMYQMVERRRQLQVPKYLTPRTDTPRLTVGHGGCFACIYSVRGAGGYQMFGVTPIPIYDVEQRQPHLRNSMIFFRAGDIVKFRPVDRAEYDELVAQVDQGAFQLRTADVRFELDAYTADQTGYPTTLVEALNGR